MFTQHGSLEGLISVARRIDLSSEGENGAAEDDASSSSSSKKSEQVRFYFIS